MMENLVWKAYYHSMSGHEIRPFNIFEHGRFREEVRKLLLKCTEKEAFAEELRRSLFYYYCSKCEWEVVIDLGAEIGARRKSKSMSICRS